MRVCATANATVPRHDVRGPVSRHRMRCLLTGPHYVTSYRGTVALAVAHIRISSSTQCALGRNHFSVCTNQQDNKSMPDMFVGGAHRTRTNM